MSDIDSAAEKISGLLSPSQEPEAPESDPPAPEAEQDAEEPLETGPEVSGEEPEGEDGGGGEPELPGLAAPATMNEEERAVFENAPREVQEWSLRLHRSQQSALTKKSQEIADKSKEVEAAIAAANEARQSYLQALESVPDEKPPHSQEALAQLKEDDPTAWVVALEENRLFTDSKSNLRSERERAQREQMEAFAAQQAEVIQKAAEQLPEIIPEWKDEKVATQEKGALVTYLKSYKYDDQVISAIADPRIIDMANKARKWDELQAGKVTRLDKVRKAPPMGSPGSPVKSKKDTDALMKRVKERGGKIDDIAALLAARQKG